jgi:tripartite-type tricarboxylate transporter receptor subunit TctC
VPFAAGGANDVIARLLVPTMSEVLGQQIVIENVGGAGGMTGASRVAKAAPDGYTVLSGSAATHAYNQTLYRKPAYNAASDFTPVVFISDQPLILIVKKELPVNNMREFIAYAKANASKMQYGSAGAGSATHLGCILFNQAIGVDITHIPYRGGAPLIQDLLGGRLDYWCSLATTGLPLIQNNSVKALAMMSRERLPLLPDLPTAHEQGLKDFEASIWNAFFLPKGAPAPIVQKLNAATVKAMDTELVRDRMTQLGSNVAPPERRTPEFLGKFVASEIERWAVPIKASGAIID